MPRAWWTLAPAQVPDTLIGASSAAALERNPGGIGLPCGGKTPRGRGGDRLFLLEDRPDGARLRRTCLAAVVGRMSQAATEFLH